MDELQRCERGLVGCALLDAKVVDDYELEIGSYQFIDSACKTLWSVLCDMRAKSMPCNDLALVLAKVKSHGLKAADLANLANEATPAHKAYFAESIRKEQSKRLLRQSFIEGVQLLDRNGEPEKVLSSVVQKASAISSSTRSVTVADTMREIAERSKQRNPVTIVESNLPLLDYMLTGGMRAGSMVILAARPSVGKSVLAAQISVDAAKDKRRTMFVSLEMPSVDVVARVLTYETGIRFAEIISGTMSGESIARCLQTAEQYDAVPMELVDKRNLSIEKLVSLVRSRANASKVDLVVVDYIGLIQGDRRKQRWEAITEISHALKSLALAENIPILCLAQLTREGEEMPPKLSMLRDSGSLEQDADVVLLMHRKRGESKTKLIVAKNRNGTVGKVILDFNEKTLRFEQSLDQSDNDEEEQQKPQSKKKSGNFNGDF